MRYISLIVLVLPALACTENHDDPDSSGPLGSPSGPQISISVPESKLRENSFGLDIGFTQPDIMPFTYSAQIIGPVQFSHDLFLAKERPIIRPKDNPLFQSFDSVNIYCGTFYEVRVQAENAIGFRMESRVFRSPDCTRFSEASCSVSNLSFVSGDAGENYLRFALAGAKFASGCTWIVETKSGPQPLTTEYRLLLRGDVEEDELVEEILPSLARGINWFRVTAYDHTPVRRSIPLENAFHIP